jgi:hypothetical protein
MNTHTMPLSFYARGANELPPSPPRAKHFLGLRQAGAARDSETAGAGGSAGSGAGAGLPLGSELGAFSAGGFGWDAIVRLEQPQDWAAVLQAVQIPALPSELAHLFVLVRTSLSHTKRAETRPPPPPSLEIAPLFCR